MNNIYLCGFMGAGKTTIAKKISRILNTSYLDTDDLIVEQNKMSIPEIFKQYGEAKFRELETQALKSTGAMNQAVIATGGGLVMNPKNVELIRKLGILIYLDTPFDYCYRRIKGDPNRPNAYSKTRQQLKELFETREQIYRQVSDYAVVCTGKPKAIAEEIIRLCPWNESY
jgi:shikimate kinase